MQALALKNRVFGLAYIKTMRASDTDLMNMSGLDTYFSQLFCKFSMQICGASNQISAVYGYRRCPQLSTVVARYSPPDESEGQINSRLASVR